MSLKICLMSWLYETLGVVSAGMTPVLHDLGFHNLHFPDVILMFVVIPFLHLLNDEETKTIIAEHNWYHGLRHIFGIYSQVTPVVPEGMPNAQQNPGRRGQGLPT